jgi:ParB family transcriptional regulator, chromosome partitioning protein
VREVEALVQDGGTVSSTSTRRVHEKDSDTRAFEKELSDLLGLKVEIKRGSGDSGNLVIKYANYEQLDYIRVRLVNGTGG